MPTDYSGIYPYIRQRLQDSVIGLADSEFDQEIGAVLRELLAPYPSQTFDAQSGDDLANLEEAAGKKVAARLHVPFSTGGADSALVLEKSDTTTRQFAQISGGGKSERDRWEQEAAAAFSRISFVKERTGKANRSIDLFGLSGPGRARERCR